jgi:hypothetical protein
MNREQRERMTELFIGMSDALRRSAVPTFAVAMPNVADLRRPYYLPEVPPQTVGQYRATIARLGKLGIVKERVQ